jgi:hypothetical protein
MGQMVKGRVAAKAWRLARKAEARGLDRSAVALYRTAVALGDAPRVAQRGLDILQARRAGMLVSLKGVVLGTIGQCNASCVHCPTGKAATMHVPRSPMPMDLYRKIIDGLAAIPIAVDGQMAFGLFGDGLVDPFVVERAKYMELMLPDIPLTINTNGAAFNRTRHEPLAPLIKTLSLHCESLIPANYDALMTPLRARNVFPKFRQILDCFPGKVSVSVPVHRKNLGELESIRTWFLENGARNVHFDALSNRCAEDRTIFESLSLSPGPIRCDAEATKYLIIDCDGTVLGCCNDFQRLEPLGDLETETVIESLFSSMRSSFTNKLVNGEHLSLKTCTRCYGDAPICV